MVAYGGLANFQLLWNEKCINTFWCALIDSLGSKSPSVRGRSKDAPFISR